MDPRTPARTLLVSIACGASALGCNAILGIQERPLRADAGALVDAAPPADGASSDAGGARDGTAPGDAGDAGGIGPYPRAVLADAPILYLRFGEPSGTVAHDQMHAFDGTYPTAGATLGAPGALAGDPDTAVELDGTRNSKVSMPPGVDFDPTQPFTAEVWVYPRATPPVGFLLDHETYTTNRAGWHLSYGDGAIFERWANGTNGGTVSTTGPLSVNAWHYLVATYDGAQLGGTERLWVDGVVIGTNTSTAAVPKVPEGWSIGGQNCDCSGNYTTGTIDELAVYDKVLTQDRIKAHYDAAH